MFLLQFCTFFVFATFIEILYSIATKIFLLYVEIFSNIFDSTYQLVKTN